MRVRTGHAGEPARLRERKPTVAVERLGSNELDTPSFPSLILVCRSSSTILIPETSFNRILCPLPPLPGTGPDHMAIALRGQTPDFEAMSMPDYTYYTCQTYFDHNGILWLYSDACGWYTDVRCACLLR